MTTVDLFARAPEHRSNGIEVQAVDQQRLNRAKRAFSTRRVCLRNVTGLIGGDYVPRAGDLVLARVARVGQHKRIEQPDGRRASLFVGDEVLVCYGNRYAPDQFEAVVPDDLDSCDLVAAGGIAGQVTCKNRIVSAATRIEPIGVLSDHRGRPVNVSQFGIDRMDVVDNLPPIIAVLGTSMNAGKTTAASRLILGLARGDKKVAAAKVTGTGAGGDYWTMIDAGAEQVLDFTDAGHASTHRLATSEVLTILKTLIGRLAMRDPDVIVLEVADGLLQRETRELVSSPVFRDVVDSVVFAASDAMGAIAGWQALHSFGHDVAALTGTFTAAPLAVREVEEAVDCQVLLKTDLSDPQRAASLATFPRYPMGVADEIATTV